MTDLTRLDPDDYALALAYIASLRSEDPYRKVGACALNSERRVIATAYNGTAPGYAAPPGFWTDRDGSRPYKIHAETNLCSLIQRHEAHTVAVTLHPCGDCAKILVAHGVRRVVYGDLYDHDPSGQDILAFYQVETVRRQAPVHRVLRAMMTGGQAQLDALLSSLYDDPTQLRPTHPSPPA